MGYDENLTAEQMSKSFMCPKKGSAPPPAKAGKASASALALAEASLRRETYAFKYVGTPEEARASLLVANGPEAAAAEGADAGATEAAVRAAAVTEAAAKAAAVTEAAVATRPSSQPTGKRAREPSSYNVFLKGELSRIKEAHPGIEHKVAFGMAAANWASSPLNAKAPGTAIASSEQQAGEVDGTPGRDQRGPHAHEPDGTENTVSSKASDRQDTAEAEQHRKKPRGRAPNDPATGKPKVWTAAGWKTADEAAACVPPQPQPKGIAAFFQRAAPTGRSVGTPPILLPASKSPITHESGASGGNAAAAPTSTPICLAPRLPTLSGTPTSSASPS